MSMEITKDLNSKGIRELKVGQVLMFDDGSEFGLQLKITCKRLGRVWAKQVYLYKQEEVFAKDKLE